MASADDTPEGRVRELFRKQHGLVTREQALRLGFTSSRIGRRVSSGDWRRLHPRVFADAQSDSSWLQLSLAACLAGGPGTVVSHRTAARLAELDGCNDDVIEVTSPRHIERVGVIAHRAHLEARECTTRAGIPTTSIVRTLIDLASVVDQERLEAGLDSAIRKGLVTPDYLARGIDRYRRRPAGARALLRVLQHRGVGQRVTESELEAMFLRLLRCAGLPLPVAQYEVWGPQGFIARTDFAYPDRRIAVECDSYRWHQGRYRWQHDLRRANRLSLAGWTIIRVTYWDIVETPDEVVAEVAQALGIVPLPGV